MDPHKTDTSRVPDRDSILKRIRFSETESDQFGNQSSQVFLDDFQIGTVRECPNQSGWSCEYDPGEILDAADLLLTWMQRYASMDEAKEAMVLSVVHHFSLKARQFQEIGNIMEGSRYA